MPGGPTRFGSRRTRFTRGSWTTGKPKTKSAKKSLINLKQPNIELNPLNGQEALTLAKKMLHGSCVPKLLPCRESQFNDIYNFLIDKLTQQIGGCMYISGVPGTGKTATVYDVINKLKNEFEFKFIEINGLRLSEPNQFYSYFLKKLNDEKMTSAKAAEHLNEYFSDPKEKSDFIILFVDELDLLKTRKQNILYHLFDWPSKTNSNLAVIAVANAMDLPEKLMMNRVKSRLGLTRVCFQPYNFQELVEIISSRLMNMIVFDRDALHLVCRKVAAVSGDVRRAFDICSRAIDKCQMDKSTFVTMNHLDKALQEIFTSPKIVLIQNAAQHEQILLKAIIQEFRISGLEEAEFMKVYKHHVDICRMDGIWVPSISIILEIAHNLSMMKIIILENDPQKGYYRRIRLNVSIDDINFALNLAEQ